MPAKWVMYIPREKELAGTKDSGGKPSLLSRANGWQTTVDKKQKYTFSVVCYPDQLPSPLGDNDVVYIFGGHGITARNGIGWPGDNGNLLDAATVAQRVIGAGLPSGFMGRLKVYSCHSGEGGGAAFAKLVADAIKSHASGCRVFGYTGEITQSYEEILLTKPGEKPGEVKENLIGKIKLTGHEQDEGNHRWSLVNKVYKGRTGQYNRQAY